MNAKEVLTAIHSGEVDNDIDLVRDALHDREKVLKRLRTAELVKGDRVHLTGLSPKYLNDRVGTFLGREGKRLKVEIDPDDRRGAERYVSPQHGLVKVPEGCVVKVDE